MTETLRPENAAQLRDALRWAAAEEQPLSVAGTGSKAALGRPTNVSARLELAGLSGITNYEPEELVLTANGCSSAAAQRRASRNCAAFSGRKVSTIRCGHQKRGRSGKGISPR